MKKNSDYSYNRRNRVSYYITQYRVNKVNPASFFFTYKILSTSIMVKSAINASLGDIMSMCE